jgi:hypothetical protein
VGGAFYRRRRAASAQAAFPGGTRARSVRPGDETVTGTAASTAGAAARGRRPARRGTPSTPRRRRARRPRHRVRTRPICGRPIRRTGCEPGRDRRGVPPDNFDQFLGQCQHGDDRRDPVGIRLLTRNRPSAACGLSQIFQVARDSGPHSGQRSLFSRVEP